MEHKGWSSTTICLVQVAYRVLKSNTHRNATMAVSSSTMLRVPQLFPIAPAADFFPSSEVWFFSGGGGGNRSPLLGSMQSPIHTEFVAQSMRT